MVKTGINKYLPEVGRAIKPIQKVLFGRNDPEALEKKLAAMKLKGQINQVKRQNDAEKRVAD